MLLSSLGMVDAVVEMEGKLASVVVFGVFANGS